MVGKPHWATADPTHTPLKMRWCGRLRRLKDERDPSDTSLKITCIILVATEPPGDEKRNVHHA